MCVFRERRRPSTPTSAHSPSQFCHDAICHTAQEIKAQRKPQNLKDCMCMCVDVHMVFGVSLAVSCVVPPLLIGVIFGLLWL